MACRSLNRLHFIMTTLPITAPVIWPPPVASGKDISRHCVSSETQAPAWEPALPSALLRPLNVLFDSGRDAEPENFLAGLQGEKLLGAGELPAGARRRMPLAWVGVALRQGSRRLFAELRGGCWMLGFPVVGRGRELLRMAGLADASALGAALVELGISGAPGQNLYFNFHYHEGGADCARVYVLDDGERRLHGFALPPSALAAESGRW